MRFLFFAMLTTAAVITSCGDSEKSSTDKFRDMSQGDSFKEDHDEPLAMGDTTLSGNNIKMNIAGAEPALGYELRKQEVQDWLIIFHEWWGLNTYVKMEAEKYYRDLGNVNVLAVDLYDGKVATTRDEASALTENTKEERIREIIRRAIAYCGRDAKIAVLGWCYGGGWSLQAAIMGGEKINGCVMYYGMPEENINELKKLQAPVLGVFANKDDHITPEIVNHFEENMKKLDKKVEIRRFDAVHAFANPSNPNYDKKATEDARQHTLTFLRFIYEKRDS